MKEECGICGISCREGGETKLYKMLVQLQHRGQLSAGITVYHPQEAKVLKTHKDLGLVNNVFKTHNLGKFVTLMNTLSTKTGIGHVRYATSGADDVDYAQPFERVHGKREKWFSMSFNGNLTNYQQLKNSLERSGYYMIRETDTEILLHLISKALKEDERRDYKEVFEEVSKQIDGAYSLAFLNAEGTLIALRDPLGIKPLCYSEKDGDFAFASESVALEAIGFEDIKDLPPGHLLIRENGVTRIERYSVSGKHAHCFFEWIYFAHPASKMEEQLVYSSRRALGRELAKLETEKVDDNSVVVAVPDSSTPAGTGFAEAMNLPMQEGLIRNRYVGRTFIESVDRANRVRDKFTILKDVFEDKKVFLIEDSIVRGTTLQNLVAFIKKVGKPREIHVRVSCPPIMWPCFYGIDMSSKKELMAVGKTEKEIAQELGVDSVIYQSVQGLVNAIGLDEKDFCLACICGKYPTPVGQQLSLFNGEGRAQEKEESITEKQVE